MYKSKRSKACDISKKVKDAVWERDNHKCIVCGSVYAMPNAHYISRAKGGRGIEENVVTLCANCHHKTDNTADRYIMLDYIKNYLQSHYPDWSEEKLIYKKGE